MSLSYTDHDACLSHNGLLCGEDSGVLSGDSPEYSSDIESPACSEESIACFIEDERNFVPGFEYVAMFRSQSLDASAREVSVTWILKVQAYYGFQPLTAYLAVNYLDRFLCCRRLPQTNGWPLQLLSVACLSLAVKMEEPLVPSLLDLQVEGAKFMFEPKTIQKMELLVLGVLDWRLRSITPFSFIAFFACKLDPAGAFIGFLIGRATEILLSNIKEACLLEFWPSCIAAAAILCAANDIRTLSLVNPEDAQSWCDGLCKDKIINCYRLMQQIVVGNRGTMPSKVLPLLRIRTRTSTESGNSSASSSSSSTTPYKRRKVDNC